MEVQVASGIACIIMDILYVCICYMYVCVCVCTMRDTCGTTSVQISECVYGALKRSKIIQHPRVLGLLSCTLRGSYKWMYSEVFCNGRLFVMW